jgi:hypothetical protein
VNFDFGALRRHDRIIGGSAIAFFIFLFFFHWLGGSSSTPLGGASGGANGWHSFTVSRWVWLITIIVALVAVAASSGLLEFHSPVQLSVAVTGLGALSVLLILYRIIHHPHGGVSANLGGVHYSASYGIKIGIWLGLIAAAALTYGGYEAMKAEGTSLSDVRDQASSAMAGARAGGASEAEAPTPPSQPPAGQESSPPPIPPPAGPTGP